jgi:phosphoacetylglucosamine mutase
MNKEEDIVLEPKSIQLNLEQIVATYAREKNVRAFYRPSGTENVVRLYVEAEDQDTVEEVTQRLDKALKENTDIHQPPQNPSSG